MSSSSTTAEPIIGPPNPQNPPKLPWAFSDCPLDILVDLLTHMLELLIKHNDQVILTPDALTRFHSRAAPGISVKDYLGRIVKYTNVEKIPLLSLLAYIDTTCTNLPSFTLSSLTVHRFLIASICAGSKAQCDVFCTNAHYAKVGGIKTQELNALERELLRVTKWDLCCHAEQLQKYYTSLIRSHGGYAQSPQPSIPPFLPFPRSRSKPREPQTQAPSPAAAAEGSAPPGQGGEAEPPDEDDAMGDSDDGEGEGDFEEEQDQEGDEQGMQIDSHDPEVSPRGRKRIRKTSGGNGMMDIDPTSPAIPQDIPTGTSNTTMDSPISSTSTGSSSVPSSSRSSIYHHTPGSGSLKARTSRLVSISESKIAEPKVDTTPAVAGPSPTHNTDRAPASASTSPLNELARRISYSDLSRPSITTGTIGEQLPTSTGHTQSKPKLPAPIPTPSRKSTSAITTSSTSHDSKSTSHSHSHSSGKLLKSLVGGIFRRKSLPGDINESLTISPSSTSSNGNGPSSLSSSLGGNAKGKYKQPHSQPQTQYNVIPSKPVQSPTLPSKSGISTSRPPSTTTSPRVYSPNLGGGTGNATRSPVSKPGLAKPVTPKVRTRDETSLDPRERVALGAPMVGMGIGVGGDEGEGKRSRIP